MATDENQKKSRSKEIKSKYEMWKPNQKFLILEKDIKLRVWIFVFCLFVRFWSETTIMLAWDKIQKVQGFKSLKKKKTWLLLQQQQLSLRLEFISCVLMSWWRPGECDRWQSSRCGWCRAEAAAVALFQQLYCVYAREPKLAAAAFLWGKHALCRIPDWLSVQLNITAHAHMQLTQKLRLSPTLGKEIWLELFQLLFQTMSVGSRPDRYDE